MEIICKQKSDIKADKSVQESSKHKEVIICRLCSNAVTTPFHKIMVNSNFTHAFANPHGLIFEIGCFSSAEGCGPASESSSEFTWFPGYSWKIGACTQCSAHLGWIFFSDRNIPDQIMRFNGLILNQLIFP